jgi:hypothetical protein
MSSSIKYQFNMPGRFRMWSLALLGIGVLSVIVGYFVYGTGDEHHNARFWATLLHNSVYFLLVVNASMFFMCATTLAWGGWQMSFRRVVEAISTAVPVVGVITLVILLTLVLGHKHHLYHWVDHNVVENDPILKGKSGFLNPTFFIVWTVLAIGLWIVLGRKMRQLSRQLDNNPLGSVEEGRRYIFKNTVWASLFMVWFVLTVMSTVPWLWLMSIDAHWYSTMYSWYTFASSFVAGVALITLFVVYLKNQHYLELTTNEHLHDLGKFMFAFSIFWTYLWFSQYMLIWYANIPEETVYFKPRVQGPYRAIFFLNLIINFLAPLLILMRRSSKRNYTVVTFMAILILFGHWLDFYQMVFAGPFKEHVELGLYDFGVALGFVGLIMFITGRSLEKYPLIAKNHPFLKESIIHHT